jgi:hypothetical protein
MRLTGLTWRAVAVTGEDEEQRARRIETNWWRVVEIADLCPDAVKVACLGSEEGQFAHMALQLVLLWQMKGQEIVPGFVVQKLVEIYPRSTTVRLKDNNGDLWLPIDVAKRKKQIYGPKCQGAQDVIHAMTIIDDSLDPHEFDGSAVGATMGWQKQVRTSRLCVSLGCTCTSLF